MTNMEEARTVGTDAMAIMGTVAGAFGPIGAPLNLILVAIDEFMGSGDAKKIKDTAFDFTKISMVTKEENYIQDARNAWAKISPACTDYFFLDATAKPRFDRYTKYGQVYL